MEEVTEHSEHHSFGDYWPSAGIVGAIFGVITFAIGLAFGYMQISSEPTGALLTPMTISGVVVCLVVAIAGAISVWHFTSEVSPFLKLGQGAIIGFLTGVAITVVSVFLNEVWHLVDPDYTEKYLEAVVANFEAMDMPAETKDQLIDSTVESIRTGRSVVQQLFYGIPMYGILNMISAMVGVKIFGKKKDQETF